MVTKLDGTARGGFVVSIVSDLGVPVKLIGVGEALSDLRDFEPILFVDSLLGYTVRCHRRVHMSRAKVGCYKDSSPSLLILSSGFVMGGDDATQRMPRRWLSIPGAHFICCGVQHR